MLNPIFERLPRCSATITCVYGHHQTQSHPAILSMIQTCRDYGFGVHIREFYPDGIEEDRECILHLPAFHMAIDTQYRMTFDERDNVTKTIESTVWAYVKEKEARQRAKERWDRFLGMFGLI